MHVIRSIVIACLIAVLLGLLDFALIFFLTRKRRRKRRYHQSAVAYARKWNDYASHQG